MKLGVVSNQWDPMCKNKTDDTISTTISSLAGYVDATQKVRTPEILIDYSHRFGL